MAGAGKHGEADGFLVSSGMEESVLGGIGPCMLVRQGSEVLQQEKQMLNISAKQLSIANS